MAHSCLHLVTALLPPQEGWGRIIHSSSSFSVPKLWPLASTWNLIFLPNRSLER